LAIFANPAFEGEWLDPKGPDNLALLGVTVDVELTDNHLKRGRIFHVMNEHRHHPMQVAHLTVFSEITKVLCDQVGALLEDRQL
jgi:hypothetical protein